MDKVGPGSSGPTDSEAQMGLDWTHLEETSIQHHPTGADLEPTGTEEERPTKKQLEARLHGGAEEAGNQLGGGGENSPGPSPVEDCRRWPMLLCGAKGLVSE